MSIAKFHMEIEFGPGNGDGFRVAGGVIMQVELFNHESVARAIHVPILRYDRFYLTSVITLCDIMIALGMCKGQMGYANVLNSKSH